MSSEGLEMWTVYRNPLDYPGKFVVRFMLVRPGGSIERAPIPAYVGSSLDEARAAIPRGLYRQERSPEDEPQILETWF